MNSYTYINMTGTTSTEISSGKSLSVMYPSANMEGKELMTYTAGSLQGDNPDVLSPLLQRSHVLNLLNTYSGFTKNLTDVMD